MGCLLATVFICGSASAGNWQEKVVVPAGYQEIEYVAAGELFWLKKPKEKNPVQYFHIYSGLKNLPEGLERGGTDINKGVVETNYAYDGYTKNSSFPLIQVAQTGKRSQQGLMDFSSNMVLPIGGYKYFYVYDDGYVNTGDELYKDGQLTMTMKDLRRHREIADGWYGDKNQSTIYNHKNEVIAELPFVYKDNNKEFLYFGPEVILAKSNGKDGQPKGYRVWNMKLEDVTPIKEGFKELIALKKTVTENGVETRKLEAILVRTEPGWSMYPYLGNDKFGEAITIAADEKEYYSSSEVAPGYYRLGRPQGDGDYLLDVKAGKVRKDANGLAYDGRRLTQEKWTSGRIFIPLVMGGFSNFYASIFSVQTDGTHLVRLRDEKGEEIAIFWESVFLGNNYIVNRYGDETKIVDYNGTVVKRYENSKAGYLPMVGWRQTIEVEEGKPIEYNPIIWDNWPGEGRYQPYCQNGEWGILDIDTMKDLITSDARYGKIIRVSDDGKQFWSYFEEGKMKGIKQFDWIE